jgi:hypothetical protein
MKEDTGGDRFILLHESPVRKPPHTSRLPSKPAKTDEKEINPPCRCQFYHVEKKQPIGMQPFLSQLPPDGMSAYC